MTFEVTEGQEEKEVDREVSDNFIKDFVEYSRAHQVGNEPQSVVTLLVYGTGLLPDWHDYAGALITGSSSGGKSHMKREVIDSAFDYADDEHGWLYQISGGSDKAAIDDEEIDESRVGAFNEYQKIPDEMEEFFKSVTEDGGFTYGRNVADSDSEGGRKTTHIERDPLPIVFMLADENDTDVGQEMKTRLIEIKVDESEEKNEAVHYAKHGHENIEMKGTDHEYMRDNDDLDHVVKSHIRDLPVDTPVALPTGDGDFEGDTWNEAEVTAPMFNFARTESTRASQAIASLIKSSALMNHHARPRTTIDSEEHIVAQPQDVGNVIACRRTLLAVTHGLTEKKFAVLDAIMERGGKANRSGTAIQATKQDVIEYIQESTDIPTMSKSEVRDILDQLDESLIINKRDHPDDARKNIYVYDGGAAFERPAIHEYYDQFEDVDDPIEAQPIERTIEQQLEALNAKMDTSSLFEDGSDDEVTSAADAMSGDTQDQTGVEDWKESSPSDLGEPAHTVAQRLHDTLDGTVVPHKYVQEGGGLQTSHMVGETPVDYDDEGDTTYATPSREPKGSDRTNGSLLNPDNDLWDSDMSIKEVESAVEDAISTLLDEGIMSMEERDDGMKVSVET